MSDVQLKMTIYGVTLSVYGAGSMASIHDAAGKLLYEGELAGVV